MTGGGSWRAGWTATAWSSPGLSPGCAGFCPETGLSGRPSGISAEGACVTASQRDRCVTTEEDTHLLAVLSNNGLHGSHVGGVHHERDGLSLSDLHDSLEHQGVVVARGECSYRHHLLKRRITCSQEGVIAKLALFLSFPFFAFVSLRLQNIFFFTSVHKDGYFGAKTYASRSWQPKRRVHRLRLSSHIQGEYLWNSTEVEDALVA